MTKLRWDRSPGPTDPGKIISVERPFERTAEQRKAFLAEQKKLADKKAKNKARLAAKAKQRREEEAADRAQRIAAKLRAKADATRTAAAEIERVAKRKEIEEEKKILGRELGSKLWRLLRPQKRG